MGKPPALPGRLPEFDNSGSLRKSPKRHLVKANREGGFGQNIAKNQVAQNELQIQISSAQTDT
jgi:hypothetical protein